MANAFGGFNTTSPLSSLPHNPLHDLSSNCIRDYFGPTVQTVADCILTRGTPHPTLAQIITKIKLQCKRDVNSERERLVKNLSPLSEGRNRVKINMARGSEEQGFVVDAPAIRAALIVLLQHSIVKAMPPPSTSEDGGSNGIDQDSVEKNIHYRYVLDLEQAAFIPRYPRFIEYAKKLFKEEGATIVEELLVNGRMTTEDLAKACVDCMQRYVEEGLPEDEVVTDAERVQLFKKVVDGLVLLYQKGFVEIAAPIKNSETNNNGNNREDVNSSEMMSGNKRKFDEELGDPMVQQDDTLTRTALLGSSDASMLSILETNPYKKNFPRGAVWRVNVKMFHASLRAFYVGRLVAERYTHKVDNAGFIITAALKNMAHKEFSPLCDMNKMADEEKHRSKEELAIFVPDEIMEFLPPKVLAELKNKAGGARSNLSAALVSLSKYEYPQVISEVEDANGHAQGGKFEIALRQLGSHLKHRILNQVIKDNYGEKAARICSILEAKGHLEGDAVAEHAMLPANDARELLHQLFKGGYVSMMNLQKSKQHDPKTAFYLWHVDKPRMFKTLQKAFCRAINNLRLRRQHEIQVGKDWIERAKDSGAIDENDSELDKLNYHKFCQGLERLDNACLQLDETLMIIKDFQF